MTARIVVYEINAISGSGIETFYLKERSNYGPSAIYLLGGDKIEVANSKLFIKT